MKKILLIALLFIGLGINAQEDTKQIINEDTITETERIVDKYGGKLAESFSEFMNTATPMAKEGFSMVVKFQIAKGIGMLLPAILTIIIGFIVPIVMRKSEWSSKGNVENGMAVLQICLWVALIILFIVSHVCTYDGVLHLIAPEWFAIKELAELFQLK